MPRMTASKSLELETFWRAHLDGWRRSDLNQREYCELHGLPLKRFGNWRRSSNTRIRPRRASYFTAAAVGLSICLSICLRKFPRPLRATFPRRDQAARQLRWRRRAMGHGLFPHRHGKAQRRRALQLPQRRARAHDARPSHEPTRQSPAVELDAKIRQHLTPVSRPDAYELSGWIREPSYGPPQL